MTESSADAAEFEQSGQGVLLIELAASLRARPGSGQWIAPSAKKPVQGARKVAAMSVTVHGARQ